jgi:D-beta-D-heptose 7-phosphate kinase/D-beta-D-heptose 1-phosphate adenosyltransferase
MSTQALPKFKILLIGDDCVDTYRFGNVTRISPEAPVPIFEGKYIITKDGMAGNVKNNLEALGCTVKYLCGDTSRKERLIDERSKQHVIRIDNDKQSVPILVDREMTENYDAIVISDYNKGTVTYELVKQLRLDFAGPIFVDTKKPDLAQFEGCFVKVNKNERSKATSVPSSQWLIVTYSHLGAVWDGWVFSGEIVGDVTDVTGAGDTFVAALAYKYLESKKVSDAIKFANKAAALTVQHVGVYAPRLEEIG